MRPLARVQSHFGQARSGQRGLETLLSVDRVIQLWFDVLPDFAGKQQRWKLAKVQVVHS